MVVIDIFSKLANVVPMKEKSGTNALSALKESFNKMGFPMSVYSDNDRAFQAGVKDFFEKEGITHVVTLTHANVVERFIRTMKHMIHDRVRFNRGSWTVMLSKALDKYNDTVHSKCDVRQRHLQQSQRGKEQSDEREIEIFSINNFIKYYI